MRSRLLTSMGALALALGGLLASAGPASATEPASCSTTFTHPDLYTDNGSFTFKSTGTNIYHGPSFYCSLLGRGFSGQGINVHCAYINVNDATWLYLEDTSTGVAGWAGLNGPNALNWNFASPMPPNC